MHQHHKNHFADGSKRGNRTLARQSQSAALTSELSWLAKDATRAVHTTGRAGARQCGFTNRSRWARITLLNVGIDAAPSRTVEIHKMRRNFLRKRKSPGWWHQPGLRIENLEGDATFQLVMEGLSQHTRFIRARNVVPLREQRMGKTHAVRVCNRVVCWGGLHESANSMRSFLQVNRDLEKMFDSEKPPSNMRAPGTTTGFPLELDMHASQNLASNMNNAR